MSCQSTQRGPRGLPRTGPDAAHGRTSVQQCSGVSSLLILQHLGQTLDRPKLLPRAPWAATLRTRRRTAGVTAIWMRPPPRDPWAPRARRAFRWSPPESPRASGTFNLLEARKDHVRQAARTAELVQCDAVIAV
eukprot:CAMPEP_0180484334 /NCGR_PEP_ID=MMETSP1036_2-20121128/35890_1 /TAXON_ID=632150 /ORGANISM="Azadinium spinosum, Strain 3D9" /LENGTH=133 /DNA_ID=CAMNT_0022492181 /DNA_START=471 /DNA_END=872 /DNA_ORIENTATION=-